MALATVEEVIEDIRWGKFAIIVDDEGRENEGAIAAQWATPEAVNFMATHGRGLICISLTGERLQELRLPMMVDKNTATFGTAFTVSVDMIEGATTGISAYDRAATIRAIVDPSTQPEDLARPGISFPCGIRRAEFSSGQDRRRP